jgi:hypothetical protein
MCAGLYFHLCVNAFIWTWFRVGIRMYLCTHITKKSVLHTYIHTYTQTFQSSSTQVSLVKWISHTYIYACTQIHTDHPVISSARSNGQMNISYIYIHVCTHTQTIQSSPPHVPMVKWISHTQDTHTHTRTHAHTPTFPPSASHLDDQMNITHTHKPTYRSSPAQLPLRSNSISPRWTWRDKLSWRGSRFRTPTG